MPKNAVGDEGRTQLCYFADSSRLKLQLMISNPASIQSPSAKSPDAKYLFVVILIAFALRTAGMWLIHSYRMNLQNDESSHIAASLASGHGFSNPFGGNTGPTAWLGPVYPFLLSRIFLIFGIQTRGSVVAALVVNCFLSALTGLPIFLIARNTFGLRVAKWSLWTWTLLPYTMYWGIRWVWDTALSALLLTILFWFTLNLARSSTLKKWVLYGLLWGFAGLTNTAELAFLPFAGVWICYQQFRQGKPFLRNAVAGALLFLSVLTPWIARNYEVFHKFIPVRGNFGLEFHLGNSRDANGMWQVWLHPTQNHGEMLKYQAMGEVAYIHSKLEETLGFVRQNPGRFAFLTFAHFFYYWSEPPHVEAYFIIYQLKVFFALSAAVLAVCGLVLALRQKIQGAVLFLLLLVSYPDIYYITFPHARYRHPIEPELLILILFLVSQVRNTIAARKET
jgi:hypothetical protein